MRAVAYEVTLYPKDSVQGELRLWIFADMKQDDLEVKTRTIYVHIDPKPISPIAKTS